MAEINDLKFKSKFIKGVWHNEAKGWIYDNNGKKQECIYAEREHPFGRKFTSFFRKRAVSELNKAIKQFLINK